MIYREMCLSDQDAVIALWKAAGVFREWNDPVRDIEKALEGEHSTILIGELDGIVVASIMCGEDGHRGWFYYVSTHPNHQGKGLGKAITAAAEDWLRARGIWKVNLLVRGDNAQAVSFYEGQGYMDTRSVCLQKVIEPV
ncbi:GNAT family acetyltransferase [Pseudovibrio ascidiaceicola]|uniref:GNAT family acetyltransferase n=1 Tax=Pseudovibrio ascidiaceicola TaxID=285279 RepID=UPI003D36688E